MSLYAKTRFKGLVSRAQVEQGTFSVTLDFRVWCLGKDLGLLNSKPSTQSVSV